MPSSTLAAKADQWLAGSSDGQLMKSIGPSGVPVFAVPGTDFSVPANAETWIGAKTLTAQATALTGLTTLGVGTTGTVTSNRYECGTPAVAANWALSSSKWWGYGGVCPFHMGVSGPNPFNDVQDDVLSIGYNSSDGGSKWVIAEPSMYLAWEAHVFDDADPSGFIAGNTHNFEFDFNQELPGINGGQRWLQFRSRRDTMDPVEGFTCWRWVINGLYGIFDVQDRLHNVLISTDTNGDTRILRNLLLGQYVTGTPGEGDLSMGGDFLLGGGGTLSLDASGVGTVVNFTGSTGVTKFNQFTEAPLLTIVPFTDNATINTPGLQAMRADQTTMAAGLGQSGVQIGAGTLRFVGNGTLSGSGSPEFANVSGVGLSIASNTYVLKNAAANANFATLDSTGLTLANSLFLGAGSLRFTGSGTLSGFGGVEMANVSGVGFSMASGAYVLKNALANATWLTIDSNGMTKGDGRNVILGTATGTKWATAANQKQGWWGATPVVQPAKIANADGTLADLTTKFNTLLAQMQTTGLQASA